MDIQILSVSDNKFPGKKQGTFYNQLEVAYKNLSKDGKVEGKKLMSFGDSKKAYDILKGANTGDNYSVKSEKIGDFWVWVDVQQGGGGGSTAPNKAAVTAPKSTYETPEERKQRQDYIIRQSSISSAIALLKTEKNVPTKEDVLALAEDLVKFVYNKPEESQSFLEDLQDDIPY